MSTPKADEAVFSTSEDLSIGSVCDAVQIVTVSLQLPYTLLCVQIPYVARVVACCTIHSTCLHARCLTCCIDTLHLAYLMVYGYSIDFSAALRFESEYRLQLF
jgi:hypothetical protein